MSKTQRVFITTPEFRVSFPQVFVPKAYKGIGKEKYSINMMFPPEADLTEMKDVCRQHAVDKWGENNLEGIRWPFKRGDDKAKKQGYEMYKGTIWCVATSMIKPQIVQPDAQTYIQDDPAAFYPGCWARAEVHFFDYDGDGRGVSIGLGNMQKTRDDDKFANRPDARDQFTAVDTGVDNPANYDDDMIDKPSTSSVIEL